MTSLEDARIRSTLISERIRQRTDLALRDLVGGYDKGLVYQPLEDLMISGQAWRYIQDSAVDPKLVFAHPVLLREHPSASLYYRGIALLPLKRVSDIAAPVATWEDGTRKRPVTAAQAKVVARLYNAVVSSIIEGATNWTLENGYRNIIGNMGIGLDGTFRNIIGRDAEVLVKNRIANWLESRHLVVHANDRRTEFKLPGPYSMRYGSEPDILFRQERGGDSQVVATVEIKGGKDPAGALERLGAMQKSFEATPPGCVNMLVAGVVTHEMRTRLEQMGVVKVFLLDDLSHDGQQWLDFINEVFHYTVRITDTKFT